MRKRVTVGDVEHYDIGTDNEEDEVVLPTNDWYDDSEPQPIPETVPRRISKKHKSDDDHDDLSGSDQHQNHRPSSSSDDPSRPPLAVSVDTGGSGSSASSATFAY